jgi:hypothetical protein
MPVDASIPLSVNQYKAPDVLGIAGEGLQLQGMQQENQMRQMKIEQQKAETEAFKGADFSTPEGRNQALVTLMSKAPQAGIGLMKTFSEIDKNQAQAKHFISQAGQDDLKTYSTKQKAIADAALPAWNAYQQALHEGKPDAVARAEADKMMPEAISKVQASGVFSQDEIASLPRTFDPVKVGSALMSTGVYSKMVQDRLHEAQTGAAEATTKLRTEQTEHPEKFHQTRETGAQLLERKDGTVISVNPNTGKVTEIQGAEGAHKPGTGGAAQQKANVRAASVASAANNSLRIMDNIEKTYGFDSTTSPIFKEDPKGVVGTVAVGLAKKAIKNKQLKLDANANSLIDEAGPAFTGGLRVNSSFREYLRNQLPSFGDPPEVAREKWALFKANIQGANSTFSKAYSGNPDYWSKSADGKVIDPNADPDFIKPSQGSQGSATPTQAQAPQAALDYLKSNPGTKDLFKKKYGYLPEGM